MKNKYFCWLFLLFALISAGANAQVKVEGSVFDEMYGAQNETYIED